MKYLYYAVILFVFTFSFLIYFSSYSLFGYRFFSVQSGSMAPELNIGDLILVKKQENYQLADVITLDKEKVGLKDYGSKFLTHRVVEVSKTTDNKTIYSIQGDQNTQPDKLVITDEDIVGKVINKSFYLGRVVDYLKTDEGMAIFIFMPAAYVIFTELRKIKKEVIREYLRQKYNL